MRLKWILGIAALLLIALIVTAFAVLSSYDFNKIKPEIVKEVLDATGRKLTLKGDIQLDIGFTPALVVEDVSFQNAQWGSRPEMIRIKRFEVQVSLLPLIKGNIDIKRLIFIEPDILVETNSEGKSNLDLEIAKKVEQEEPEKQLPEEGINLPALTFNRLHINKGRLTYRDGVSRKSFTLLLDDLMAYTSGLNNPVELEMGGRYNDAPFQVNGTLGPMVGLIDPDRSWPLRMELKAAASTFIIDGTIKDVLNAKGFAFSVTSEGLSIPNIATLAGVIGIPDVGPFKAVIKASDPNGRLTVENLDVRFGTDKLVEVKVTGSIENPLDQRGFDLQLYAHGNELKNLEKLVNHRVPFGGPFNISGHAMDTGDKVYKVSDLKIGLGKMDINGSMEIGLSGDRPRLKANLSSNILNLKPIFQDGETTKAPAEKADKTAKKTRLFPEEPLPLDILKKANADLKFNAGQVVFPHIALDDLSLNAILENGNLAVKDLRSIIGKGSLKGSTELRSRGKETIMGVVLNVEQLDIGQMLRELEGEKIIEGKIDLDIDLKSEGDSVAGLMAGMNGMAYLIAGKGRIDNSLMNIIGANLTSQLFRLLNPLKEDVDYTAINCLVSRFDIKDGLANSTALVLDTNQMSLIGEGIVNLKTEEIALSIKPSPKEGMGIKGLGKLSMSLGELARPLKLSGTLANPSLAIDPTQTAITLGKAIGGTALFGPLGIAAALARGVSGKDENPCLCAIEAAKKGTASDKRVMEDKEGVNEESGEERKGIGSAFKKLFGR